MVDLAENGVQGDGTLTAKQTCMVLGIKYDTLRKWMDAKPPKIKSDKMYGVRIFHPTEVNRIKNLMRSRRGMKRGQSFLPLKSKAPGNQKGAAKTPPRS